MLKQLLKDIDVAIIEFDSFPLKRSLNIHNGDYIADFIKRIYSKIKTIAVGNDCILYPRLISNIDYVFQMEAEASISYVVECLLKGQEVITEYIKTLGHLDDLPFPDRGIISSFAENGGSINKKPNLAKSTLIQTSRGCINTCRFCQRKGWGNIYREHSIDYVVREFSQIAENRYVNVWICDDNFTFNLNRAKKILKLLIADKVTDGMNIALSSWTNIDLEFLELAKQANVSVISMGIESTNQEILEFYKKKIDLEKTQELICHADELGIYTVGNFIIGAPMETEETINMTFDYIMNVPFDQVNIKVLDYMLGSELYKTIPDYLKNDERHIFACKENGLNNFSLVYLKYRINNFQEQFSMQRRSHFIKKANQFGFPYRIHEADQYLNVE